MTEPDPTRRSQLPSVDRVLHAPAFAEAVAMHGRSAATDAVRVVLEGMRAELAHGKTAETDEAAIAEQAAERLAALAKPTLIPVHNLTGTVLHTNLGRAPLPDEAIRAMAEVASAPANLEFDLGSGRRGDRDVHVDELLCELTGAEAATVVNNNAAAVLLVLNTLAQRKEVPVSRGELIEIGGAFRLPDVMKKAGSKLIEVGTTNRTHAADYADAVTPATAAFLKVHTSNYVVQGFTAEVKERELASLAHENGILLIDDLGAGALTDMSAFGLPREPVVADVLADGADVVTFSGDKLLGGPQAGLIVGGAELIKRIKKNPMKRALRLDKLTLAGLAAVLRLYRDPERVAERIPALRLLARPADEIRGTAQTLADAISAQLGAAARVDLAHCESQIGSGALPVDRLASWAVVVRPPEARTKGVGGWLKRLARNFRDLPEPVVGRVKDDAFWLDARCLEDAHSLISQLDRLPPP